jgi:hypothetical protein
MADPEKTREDRLRRMAKRQGLRLVKSRRRDKRALDYSAYGLIDTEVNAAAFGYTPQGRMNASLDDIEAYLMRERDDN